MNDKNEREKKSNKRIWLSCLVTLIVLTVIAGFIISLVTHIYWLTVTIAGCFLLSLDSILLIGEFEKQRKRNFTFPLIILVAGVCAVICGIMLKIDPDGFKNFALKYTPLAGLLLFLFSGIGIILSALTEPTRKRRYCTEKVTGVCVDFQVSLTASRGRRRSRAPIYEFYYAGETHRIVESTYSNFANPQIGEEREIYVDTESLDEIYEPIRSRKLSIMTCGLGICFVAMALLGLIMGYVVK